MEPVIKRLLAVFFVSAVLLHATPPPGYVKVFDANFNTPGWLPLIEWNTLPTYDMAKWWQPCLIDHTPWAGDFGDAAFTTRQAWQGWGKMFLQANQDLNGKWWSAMAASVDTYGNGFSAGLLDMNGTRVHQGVYWEVLAQMPIGQGVWPGIVLNDLETVHRWPGYLGPNDPGKTRPYSELDIIEKNSGNAIGWNITLHIFSPNGEAAYPGPYIQIAEPKINDGKLHAYGCLITDTATTFYLDDVPRWSYPTDPYTKYPMLLYVDYALGSGYPVSPSLNGTKMVIGWMRCYVK